VKVRHAARDRGDGDWPGAAPAAAWSPPGLWELVRVRMG